MGAAKVVNLHVRAAQISHLCFETGGILSELRGNLGDIVNQFDFPSCYALLGSMPSIPGHPARLVYDFMNIDEFTREFALATLRAETARTAVNKAVNGRANAFYAKYANTPAIIARMNAAFSPGVSDSKATRLEVLASISKDQMDLLRQAYVQDGRTGVVRETTSQTKTDFWSNQFSLTEGYTSEKDATLDATNISQINAPVPGDPVTEITNPEHHHMEEGIHMGADMHEISGSSRGRSDQDAVNTDYGYRVPYLENLAQYERAQISLIDEQFTQFMANLNLPYLAAVFQNELQMIDSDVYRTQISYLKTILLSPIQGVITGVYKQPGDAVQPGEPVIRVENSASILLVASVVFRGRIALGMALNVRTQIFGATGPATTISGTIVSARGRHEDDHWDIVARCSNLDDAGKLIFPLGYHFDFEDTTITIN